MLTKLINLIEYCQAVAVEIPNISKPHIVADKEQGTTVLNNPSIIGPQTVISLPLASLGGDCDNPGGSYTVMIFALEKGLEQSGTQPQYVAQYLETADLLGRLLGKFLKDMGGSSTGRSCPILTGMEISECIVAPEAGIFGGWNGYSATLTLK